MHDPMVVAFEIVRPLPRRSRPPVGKSTRWKIGRSRFWTLAGRELYWPPLITVWHNEPHGRDAGQVCKHYRRWRDPDGQWQSKLQRSWRFHIHHWSIQVHPLQTLRRRLLTRCEWCNGRSAKSDPVNVSHQWDGPRGRWWQGEPGLYHRDCSAISSAHANCICHDPVLEQGTYGRCARCNLHRPFGMTEEKLTHARDLASIPTGARNR